MVRNISSLLLMSLQYLFINGSKRTVRMVYKPYGPQMCKELCRDSFDSFSYTKADLSCCRLAIHDPDRRQNGPTENSFICNNKGASNKSKMVVPRKDLCDTNSYDEAAENLSRSQPELDKKAFPMGHLDLLQYNYTSILHKACENGNLCVIKRILAQGSVDINCRGKKGRTPVMVTTVKGHMAVFDYLVSQGCDLSLVDDNDNNVIHLACAAGYVEIVKKLESSGKIECEMRGWYGLTPILFSAQYGHTAVFEVLVANGCNLTALDDTNMNILHLACAFNHVNMAEYILSKHMAGIESTCNNWTTPLMVAVKRGHLAMVDFLVSKGANITAIDNRTCNILHRSCIDGNVDIVKHILTKYNIDKDSAGFHGRTPVWLAAEMGHKDVVILLESYGCNLTVLDADYDNILHAACMSGHVDMVKYILTKDLFGVESRGFVGRTPVMVASEHGHREVVDFLVSKSCNLTVRDTKQQNILHVACLGGHIGMVKYILRESIIDTESKDYKGRTPVILAGGMGHKQLVILLASSGCNLTVLSVDNDNILHAACRGGHVDMVKYILKTGIVDIDSRGFKGRTPVLQAALMGHKGVVIVLVSWSCNLKVVDAYNENILHSASRGGHVDLVQFILAKDLIGIESRGFNGMTSVMIAAKKGYAEVVSLLIKKGCSLTVFDLSENNMLHVACTGGLTDIVKTILTKCKTCISSRNNQGETPLISAVEIGNVRLVDLLVKSKGCNKRATDNHRKNILHVASVGGHIDMVKYILSKKIVDIDSQDNKRRTPIMLAAREGHRDVVVLLVSNGCKLTLVDDYNNTILHIACIYGHVDMVDTILSKDMVSLENKGFKGMTPVMLAAKYGQREVVDLLVRKGCNINALDIKRNNILYVACAEGHVHVVKYILTNTTFGIDSRDFKGIRDGYKCGKQRP